MKRVREGGGRKLNQYSNIFVMFILITLMMSKFSCNTHGVVSQSHLVIEHSRGSLIKVDSTLQNSNPFALAHSQDAVGVRDAWAMFKIVRLPLLRKYQTPTSLFAEMRGGDRSKGARRGE